MHHLNAHSQHHQTLLTVICVNLICLLLALQLFIIDLPCNVFFCFQEKIMRIYHVWAFCRDQNVLDPRASWRLIDLSSSPAEQFI